MSSLAPNTLYYGDCLDWMGEWDDESVDLIYLDPPFNSKANYNVLYGTEGSSEAQYRAFEDTWHWDDKAEDRLAMFESAIGRPAHNAIEGLFRILGRSGMLAYLTYMAERLEHMHRLLKPSASLYLHCDSTASHYLKVVLDAIFGPQGFRAEITWQRTSSHNDGAQGRREYGHICDVILFYTRGTKWSWNRQYMSYDQQYTDRFYRHIEEGSGRRYQLGDLTGPGGAAKGNPIYEVMGVTRYWRYSQERMQQLIDAGRVIQTAPGRAPRYKRYLDEMPGKPLQDLWTDIKPIGAHAKERLGYPTQKPLALLERIIKASSNEGDLVLDPFCGCGTAVEAAQRLGRQWAGIDISPFAIDLIKKRRLRDPSIPTLGIPLDLTSARKLARERPFDFESWAVTRLPGFIPNTKQVADGGVDGRATLAQKPDNYDSRLALAQVKGGKHSLSALRDFIRVANRDRAAVGCFVTLDPISSRAARSEAASVGKIYISDSGQLRYDYPRVQLWSIRDYFEERPLKLPIMADPYTGKAMTQQAMF